MKHICKSFSGVYANEDINLTVEKGEIHALLGENGAGKTTLMNILFGLYRADSGEIFWKDQLANFTSPKEAIAAGVGMVQQHFSLVNKMTVLDNVILNLKGNAFVLNRAAARARLVELAEKYGLQVNPDALICELSVGEQQRVEILKALYRNVELLILDEPTGVLTPQETTQFFDVLRNLKNEGYGIIIITHRMSEIMAISDRVTILRDGKQVADLVTAETNPGELSAYMIGRELNESYNIEGTPKAENMLVMKHVSNDHKHHGRHKIEAIDLVIRKGEILGIAGVEGNGQKELAEVITGIQKKKSGQIILDGQDMAGIRLLSHIPGIHPISGKIHLQISGSRRDQFTSIGTLLYRRNTSLKNDETAYIIRQLHTSNQIYDRSEQTRGSHAKPHTKRNGYILCQS